MMTKSSNENGSEFEKALLSLQKSVAKIESGELNLEEALKEYENGVRLTQVCQKLLTEAEQKIEFLERKQ